MHSAERDTMSDFDTVTVSGIPDGPRSLTSARDYEWVAGHAAGALHIPLDQLPARLEELDPDEDLYVICRTGGRSFRAAQWLVRSGIFRLERGRRHGPVAGDRNAAGVRQRTQARHPVVEERSADARITRHLHLPRTREGTFTEAALMQVPDAAEAVRIPSSNVNTALDKVRDGSADAAMVPIENSVEGGVTATLDAIATGQELQDPPRGPGAHQLRPGGQARHGARGHPARLHPRPCLGPVQALGGRQYSQCWNTSRFFHRRGRHGLAGRGRRPLRRRDLRPDRGHRAAGPDGAGGKHRRQPRSRHPVRAGGPARANCRPPPERTRPLSWCRCPKTGRVR